MHLTQAQLSFVRGRAVQHADIAPVTASIAEQLHTVLVTRSTNRQRRRFFPPLHASRRVSFLFCRRTLVVPASFSHEDRARNSRRVSTDDTSGDKDASLANRIIYYAGAPRSGDRNDGSSLTRTRKAHVHTYFSCVFTGMIN